MMTIAIASQKGGVGKTTSTISIGTSHGAEDYLALCKEIVGRENQ